MVPQVGERWRQKATGREAEVLRVTGPPSPVVDFRYVLVPWPKDAKEVVPSGFRYVAGRGDAKTVRLERFVEEWEKLP